MSSMFIYIWLLAIHHAAGLKNFPADKQIVNILGLFGVDETEEQNAFKMAVNDVNTDTQLLKITFIQLHVEIVDLIDSFNISNTICRKLSEGIVAIFGANSDEGISIVQSIAESFQIPFIQIVSEPTLTNDSTTINMFPKLEYICKGISDMIHDMDWVSFTLIYEPDTLLYFQELIISHDSMKYKENYNPIVFKELPNDNDYGPLLKEVRTSSETRILLGCSSDKILPILRRANSLDLMGDYFAYVIVSFDAHTLDFTEFAATRANITLFTIAEPYVYISEEYEEKNAYNEGSAMPGIPRPFDSSNKKTQAVLQYDSVRFFAKSLDLYLHYNELNPNELTCDSDDNIFVDGPKLSTFIKTTALRGLTGPIKIDESGQRNYFILTLIQLTKKGPKTLGTWDPENSIGYTRNRTQMSLEIQESIANKTFIVLSVLAEPYMMNSSVLGATGNDRYEGFAKDLMQTIAEDLKFTYTIEIVPERGSKINGKWNGLIKELQERRADLGIGDLTITHERRQAVEFTKPFMTLGISILYKKSEEEETDLFSFLLPLEFEVWLCVATALLGVSIIIFFISRCTPYDWENPHPCDPNVDELENQLSIVNCLWFSLGSVLQQGCDILPKAVSSRVAASMWWFFTLIMVSTYTANLAAFLTSKQMVGEITDAESLAAQSKVQYGCQLRGSTRTFFETSTDNLYQKIWATMESAKPSVFTTTADEGVQRVLQDNKGYAFFMESSSIEFKVEKHCELTQVDGLLDNKGYGIAMPLNSPYRTYISASVLKQQENGFLRDLKEKWWTNNKKDCGDSNKADDQDENALDVTNVGGVFVVLIVGMLFSFALSLLEFLWNIRKVAVVEKISVSTAFWKEFQFVINCSISTKPVRKASENNSSQYDPLDRYKELLALNNRHDM